jgi:hypothetical membrane protein
MQTAGAQVTKSTVSGAQLIQALLRCGIIAGPIYVALGIIQVFLRPGFNPTRHDLSLLSNGELGWIQIGNFLLTGALVVAAAVGMRLRLRGSNGSTWGPLLLAFYGLGLIGAGLFVADPMNGFPPGTSDGAPVHATLHSLLHIIFGAVGFLGLITACFVLARRFAGLRQTCWAAYSILTGIVFLAGFAAIATSSQLRETALQVVTLAFTTSVLLAWSWISAVSAHFARHGEAR